jgi:hypothetical protein
MPTIKKSEKCTVIRLWLHALPGTLDTDAKKFLWWMCEQSNFFTTPFYAKVPNQKLLTKIRILYHYGRDDKLPSFNQILTMIDSEWSWWEYNSSGIWAINDHNVSTSQRDKTKDGKFTKKLAKTIVIK